uniref:Odorant receptor n=1 Tax=Sirex nitobei TaxID=1602346 RepID=A0A857N993_9HYME|nr:odorant receptor 25 [Sirex nitobei]
MERDSSETTTQVDLLQCVNVITWNRQIFNIIGLWPTNIDNRLFFFFFAVTIVHCCLEYAELLEDRHFTEYLIPKLAEKLTLTMIIVKLGMYRLNIKRLYQVINDIEDDYEIDKYKTLNERLEFLKYNKMAKRFIKVAVPSIFTIGLIFYLRPLLDQIISITETANSSMEYVLPYKARYFFEITELHTYVLTYVLQVLTMPLVICGYTGIDCFLVTLVFHACGQFSVLALQLKNITMDPVGRHHGIEQVIVNHLRIMRLTKKLNKAFAGLLLPQILSAPIIICLVGYSALNMSWGPRQRAELFTFVLFSLNMLFILFAYCFIGECLIMESISFCDALYNSNWYDLPPEHARLLIICMCQAQRPLELTAGQFYVFSLEQYTYVVKTSLAYLSMMRTLL